MIELVLGGARSGKSRYAEHQAGHSGLEVVYIATSEARDLEMHHRIERHRQRRPAHWLTVEEPIQLADCLLEQAAEGRCLLVDCLTLWQSNLMFDQQGLLTLDRFAAQRAALLGALPSCPGQIILVSNEIGQGVVAADAMTRRFVDEAGLLHQDLAEVCQRVTLVTAGLPLRLK